jgi:PAS domain S-box-containing protein
MNEAFDERLEIYKKLFLSINEGIVLGRAIYNQSGQLYDYCHLEVNSAFENILGISSVNVQGKTWREVQYFDSIWIELFTGIGPTGSSLIKEYYDTKHHQWFHIKILNMGLGIIAILLAESTKERQEAERRANELDTAISAIAAGVIILDKSGKIIRMNQFASQLFRESGEIANCEQLFYKVAGPSYRLEDSLLRRVLKGEFIQDQEFYIEEAPGKFRWHAVTLSPIFDNGKQLNGVIMIMTDITERKRKEKSLLTFERESLKVTLNSLDEGVVTIDPDKQIIFVNKAASNLIGYPQSETIGKPLSEVFYFLNDITSEPVDITINAQLYQQLVLVNRDLREVTVTVNRTPIKDIEDQIIGTVIVIEDITEKQKIDQEMLKTAKLESLAVLAGGVAHDFNNVLAGILANLQLASTKLKRHEDISKNLDTTACITRKASELTKQLLTFAKGGNPVRRSILIIDLIRDTVQFILSGSKVKAELYLPQDLWVVDVDEGQIAQVINNITINAKQAMPIGGILQIFGENVTLDATDQHIPGRYVKLTLKDHGIGIPEGIIDKIFDPFFTTKKTGNGLGLSTSYSIIKKHNGYLKVESTPGVGTIFYIFLPASTQQLEVKKANNEVVICDRLKVLLMDDEESIRNVSGEMLTYFGYHVTLARDGQEAIKFYKEAMELGEPFDVVIMDLTIPGGLGGMETMAVLRQIDPEIKAIITSGYTNDQVMAEYRKYGFSGVVTKPYQINELNEVLVKVIDQQQLPLGLMY